tara:strand:+ start:246 stop:578 length:333 start_codon:yes stop_codon:yes gene_type:complete
MANPKYIAKARKKSEVDIALQRVEYQKHLFEIKQNIFLTIDTYNDLVEAYNKAVQKNKDGFNYKGQWFTTDYAAFCLHRYDNIDPSFDEQMFEYYAKKAEEQKETPQLKK